MADNINNINSCDDDKDFVPLPINESRLKEIKAMEEAEQSLIEDLFSTPSNTYVKALANTHVNVKALANVKAPTKTIPLSNKKESKNK